MVNDVAYKKVQVWLYCQDQATKAFQVLVLRTHQRRGRFWQPVTGKVEPKEHLVQAALREAQEETGLNLTAETNHPEVVDYEFEFDGKFGRAKEYTFAIEVSEALPIKIDPNEHEAFEWVSPSEALKRMVFDTNKIALTTLLKKWILKR